MPDRSKSPEELWNYEDLRDGITLVGPDGTIESVSGGTAVPPNQSTEYHPMIVRIYKDKDGMVIAKPPVVMRSIIGKNTMILSATADSAIFMVREDNLAQGNTNRFSVYHVQDEFPDSPIKLDEVCFPIIDGFNNVKTGIGGSFVKRNGLWMTFMHGQTYTGREHGGKKEIEYKQRLIGADQNNLFVTPLEITRDMFYPISPAEVELRDGEKKVVYIVDSMRLHDNNVATAFSTGDINTAEVLFANSRIDEAFDNADIYPLHGSLHYLSEDVSTPLLEVNKTINLFSSLP
jgi:hypothetical protein